MKKITTNEYANYPAGNDKDLLPIERETHLNFSDKEVKDKIILIDSYQKTVIQSLVDNPNFVFNYGYINEGKLIYVAGELPLHSLRINRDTGKDELNYIVKY